MFATSPRHHRRGPIEASQDWQVDCWHCHLRGIIAAAPLKHAVEQLAMLIPGACWHHPKLEADDVIAMLCHKSFSHKNKVFIVSSDHDLWQLISKRVSVLTKDGIVEQEHILEKFGLTNPKAIPLHKALFGEHSDNIPPAVKNLKRNPWLKIINLEDLRTPQQLLAHIEQGPQAAAERIVEAWADVERNWKLIKLRKQRKLSLVRSESPPDDKELLKFLKLYECKSLLKTASELWVEKPRLNNIF